MHIHRSAHAFGFTVLPNALLQDRRLSFTSRGLLVDLLSRPDGWREDGRQMADSSPQGRLAVAKGLRELAAAGYYQVIRVRRPDGTFVSEAHIWDTPQSAPPNAVIPGSGAAGAAACDAPPVKDPGKEPTLPAAPQPWARATDPAATEAVALLFRVLRPEPRLRLGTVEALTLAPLVAAWLERGCTAADLSRALLPGLPARMHSAAALLRDRLIRKLPPELLPEPLPDAAETGSPVAAERWECRMCGLPVAQEGICPCCAGLGSRTVAVGRGEAATARGAALVRAAMRRATA
ncbi:hypothetical protein GXW82_41800 [Streptacidiphilus sp. 4-A2]|nr:hypothetical protein [Streptacidiphilus sp. 4-A2]